MPIAEKTATPAEIKGLKRRLAEAGLSASDLATAAEVDRATISRWFGGSRPLARWKYEHLTRKLAALARRIKGRKGAKP